MATSDYLRVITVAIFVTFANAIDSGSALNPFAGSAFRNGNTSMDIVPRSLNFGQLSTRQLQCDNPGWCMIPNLIHPLCH
jgi:hypothetical protein